MNTDIDRHLTDQESRGPYRKHVPLLRRILEEIRKGRQAAHTWSAAVNMNHVISANELKSRPIYTVRPWLLGVMNETALLKEILEKGGDRSR